MRLVLGPPKRYDSTVSKTGTEKEVPQLNKAEEFGKWIKDLRIQRGMTQQQLADKMYVSLAAVSHWETGKRQPDVETLARLAECLAVPASEMFEILQGETRQPVVLSVDDERIVLEGCLETLTEAMPGAVIRGYTSAVGALNFARETQVDLAFLDIDMGKTSGFDLCRELIQINPRINVIYLTAFPEFSLDAWSTGACGFLLKPVSVDAVRERIPLLRYPVRGLETK